MRSHVTLCVFFAAYCTLVCIARAADIDVEAEKRSFFPLIPDSTYTYEGVFNERKSTNIIILKTMPLAGSEAFYFVETKDIGNPDAILGPNSIGLGLYFKADDGIATLHCFFKNETNRMTSASLAKKVTILKTTPEPDAVIEAPTDETMKRMYRVIAREDVSVPAGVFKECLKLTIEEIHKKTPPEKDIIYTATAWLAQGVGVVKWIRGTGRVEELTAYKLGDGTKK